jgi:uncharacterized protein YpmB
MLKQSYSEMKKVLAILLAVLFVVSVTAAAVSAEPVVVKETKKAAIGNETGQVKAAEGMDIGNANGTIKVVEGAAVDNKTDENYE